MRMPNNLIIAGVHKAGTTSLYTYLSWHPDVCGASIKETHFFSGDEYQKRFNSYNKYFDHHDSERYWLEASPEYIYGVHSTISRMKSLTNDPKIIILLRDPADKIFSSFKHRQKRLMFNEGYGFDDFYKEHLDIADLSAIDMQNQYQKELVDGNYIEYLPVWFENFEPQHIKIIFFDELKADPGKVVNDLCKWLEIDSTFYKDKEFVVENKSVNFKNKFLQSITLKLAQKLEPVLRKNYKVKKMLREIYYAINVKKQEVARPDALSSLDELYKAKNLQLKSYLKSKGYTSFPEWL
ncbi:MAG: sulfotransferase [Leeuwenhoekiella sp.]|uniref:sulfotransferase family protein n=1 Tax=Leeuwenhoekiella sp. TaxID=1977054 RepID=UPI003242347D